MICKQWRKEHARILETGEKLENFALQMGLEDFEVEAYRWENTLSQQILNESIQDFSARVKRLVDILGSADYVRTENNGTDINAPTMLASWTVHDFFVTITSREPQCKIDPRTEYIAPQYSSIPGHNTKIHPECQSVLEELSEL